MIKRRKYTPENITKLLPNEIFVFGSNLSGNHIGGAARVAVDKFGAKMGIAIGIQGQSYAIPTLNKKMQKVDRKSISSSLNRLIKYANTHSQYTFYVTKIGCGIAGFSLEEMIEIFKSKDFSKSPNIILPKEFTKRNFIERLFNL